MQTVNNSARELYSKPCSFDKYSQPRSQGFSPPRRGRAPFLSSAEKSPGNEVEIFVNSNVSQIFLSVSKRPIVLGISDLKNR